MPATPRERFTGTGFRCLAHAFTSSASQTGVARSLASGSGKSGSRVHRFACVREVPSISATSASPTRSGTFRLGMARSVSGSRAWVRAIVIPTNVSPAVSVGSVLASRGRRAPQWPRRCERLAHGPCRRRRGRSRSPASSAENEAGIKRSGPSNRLVVRGYDQSYSRFFSINPMDGKRPRERKTPRVAVQRRAGLPSVFRFKGNEGEGWKSRRANAVTAEWPAPVSAPIPTTCVAGVAPEGASACACAGSYLRSDSLPR